MDTANPPRVLTALSLQEALGRSGVSIDMNTFLEQLKISIANTTFRIVFYVASDNSSREFLLSRYGVSDVLNSLLFFKEDGTLYRVVRTDIIIADIVEIIRNMNEGAGRRRSNDYIGSTSMSMYSNMASGSSAGSASSSGVNSPNPVTSPNFMGYANMSLTASHSNSTSGHIGKPSPVPSLNLSRLSETQKFRDNSEQDSLSKRPSARSATKQKEYDIPVTLVDISLCLMGIVMPEVVPYLHDKVHASSLETCGTPDVSPRKSARGKDKDSDTGSRHGEVHTIRMIESQPMESKKFVDDALERVTLAALDERIAMCKKTVDDGLDYFLDGIGEYLNLNRESSEFDIIQQLQSLKTIATSIRNVRWYEMIDTTEWPLINSHMEALVEGFVRECVDDEDESLLSKSVREFALELLFVVSPLTRLIQFRQSQISGTTNMDLMNGAKSATLKTSGSSSSISSVPATPRNDGNDLEYVRELLVLLNSINPTLPNRTPPARSDEQSSAPSSAQSRKASTALAQSIDEYEMTGGVRPFALERSSSMNKDTISDSDYDSGISDDESHKVGAGTISRASTPETPQRVGPRKKGIFSSLFKLVLSSKKKMNDVTPSMDVSGADSSETEFSEGEDQVVLRPKPTMGSPRQPRQPIPIRGRAFTLPRQDSSPSTMIASSASSGDTSTSPDERPRSKTMSHGAGYGRSLGSTGLDYSTTASDTSPRDIPIPKSLCRICERMISTSEFEEHSKYCALSHKESNTTFIFQIRRLEKFAKKAQRIQYGEPGSVATINLLLGEMKVFVAKENASMDSMTKSMAERLIELVEEKQQAILEYQAVYEFSFSVKGETLWGVLGGGDHKKRKRGLAPLIKDIQDKKPTIDDFDIIKPIRKGAFGSVSLARKRTTGDVYAIKEMKKAEVIKKNMVEHVLVERQILTKMHNPHFVRLYFALEDRESLYLVMEYCVGGDILSLLQNVGCLDEDAGKKYLAEIVLALEYLHKFKAVHRDLKPDNILIDRKPTTPMMRRKSIAVARASNLLSPPPSLDTRMTSSVMSQQPHRYFNNPAFSIHGDITTPGKNKRRSTSAMPQASVLDDVPESPSRDTPMFDAARMSLASVPEIPYALSDAMSPPRPTIDLTRTAPSTASRLPFNTLPNTSSSLNNVADNKAALGTPDYLAPEILLGHPHGVTVDYWSLGIIAYEMFVGVPPFNDADVHEVFQNVLKRNITWPGPDEMSAEAHDLIDKLLQLDPKHRLGYNGINEIKRHPFFKGIDWKNLLEQPPVFVPRLENPCDTSYFAEVPNASKTNNDNSSPSPAPPAAVPPANNSNVIGSGMRRSGSTPDLPRSTSSDSLHRLGAKGPVPQDRLINGDGGRTSVTSTDNLSTMSDKSGESSVKQRDSARRPPIPDRPMNPVERFVASEHKEQSKSDRMAQLNVSPPGSAKTHRRVRSDVDFSSFAYTNVNILAEQNAETLKEIRDKAKNSEHKSPVP